MIGHVKYIYKQKNELWHRTFKIFRLTGNDENMATKASKANCYGLCLKKVNTFHAKEKFI